jgi:hypothetical protein
MNRKTVLKTIGIILAIVTAVAFCRKLYSAEPIPKVGTNCPNGYHREGHYCVPNKPTVPPVIIQIRGECPKGYHPKGDYCIKN